MEWFRFPCFYFFLILSLSHFLPFSLSAQNAPRSYWVQFTDKHNSPYSLSNPLAFLSQRSIDRRQRQGLSLDSTDLPVNPAYVDSIKKMGVNVLYTSRWLNSVTIHTDDSLFPDKVKKFPFVASTKRLMKKERIWGLNNEKSIVLNSAEDNFTPTEYGSSYQQIAIHHGDLLHRAGFTGKDVRIAQLDAGWQNIERLSAFNNLFQRHGILGIHDFVAGSTSLFEDETHGMWVLSVMTGYIQGKLIGAAPDADFYLFRTENAPTEFLIEEANWVAGIEWADSQGADIVNSSLGYTQFDDSTMNHTYADMNGHTAYSSKAAGMAARKGIIVVNSAGNSGSNKWHYISAPADADSILTIGALQPDLKVAGFSSRGPSSDKRIKPDVMAIGGPAIVASLTDGETQAVSGTSISAPIITGLTACLWQAFPNKSAMEIINAIKESSDRYSHPDDSLYGYGIPDFMKAYNRLCGCRLFSTEAVFETYPNPFQQTFTVDFFTPESEEITLTLTDGLGKIISTQKIVSQANIVNRISLSTPPKNGIYFVNLLTPHLKWVKKVERMDF